MSNLDKATETQIKNIQTRSGKSMDELHATIRKSGLSKHGEIRDMLKTKHGMGHGDANLVVTLYLQSTQPAVNRSSSSDDVVDQLYSDKKAHLRPIHDRLMSAINKFGEFEVAPKKTYVSLRRKKQFAMIGPATQTRVEVGLNVKTLKAKGRLEAMPAGGMCQFKVNVTSPDEVDQELIGWIRAAYDSAG